MACNFCSLWDWSESSAKVDNGKYAHIHNAGGYYRYPLVEQFNFCPVCGGLNPNKVNAAQHELLGGTKNG